MASKELIEKVARSIKNADREVFTGLDYLYEEQAKAAISTILDALKEPTREVLDELMRGCFTDEGEPYGSAYVLTPEGYQALKGGE